MTREEVMEYMQRYLDDDLSDEEYSALVDHLQHDQEASELFERMQRLSNDLANLPKVTPPYSIVDTIIPKLDQLERPDRTAGVGDDSSEDSDDNPPQSGKRSQTSWPLWTGIAGGITAAVLLGVFVLNGLQQQTSQLADSSSGSSGFSAGDSVMMTMDAPLAGDSSHAGHNQRTAEKSEPSRSVSEPIANSASVPEPNQDSLGLDDSRVMIDSDRRESGFYIEDQAGVPIDGGTEADQTPIEGRMNVTQVPTEGESSAEGAPGDELPQRESVIGNIRTMTSPNGAYSAVIHWDEAAVTVTIRGAEDVIYTSEPQAADEMDHFWSDNSDTFTYILIKDEERKRVEVDVRTGTELRE